MAFVFRSWGSGNKLIKKLADGDRSLKEVSFSSGELTDENALALCDSLRMGAKEWIERITLSKTVIATRYMVALLQIASECPRLQTLELPNCGIKFTEDMITSLMSTRVSRLSLSGNPISDVHAARLVSHPHAKRLFLDSIAMTNPNLLCDTLRDNKTLLVLSLTYNNLQTTFAESLSAALFDSNSTIQTIHLEGNPSLKGTIESIEIALHSNRKKARQSKTGSQEPELDLERENEQLRFNIELHEKGKKESTELVESLRKQVATLEEKLQQESDQQASLTELLEKETKECKQLEEDMAASTDTFMQKIASLSEIIGNQRKFISTMEKQSREPEPQELVMQMVEEHVRLNNNSFSEGVSNNNSFASPNDAPELPSTTTRPSQRKKRATSSGTKLAPAAKELLSKIEKIATETDGQLLSILQAVDDHFSSSFVDQFSTCKSEAEVSIQQLQEFADREQELKNKIEDLTTQITLLNDTVEESSTAQQELTMLRQTYDDRCAEHKLEITKIEEAFNAKFQSSVESSNELEEHCSQLRNDIKTLRTESENLKEKHNEARSIIKSLENEISNLRGSASSETTTILEGHSAELQALRDEHKSSIQSYKDTVATLQQEADTQNQQLSTNKSTIDSLTKQVETLQSELTTQKEDHQQATSLATDTQTSLNESNAKLLSVEEDLAKALQESKEKDDRIKDLETEKEQQTEATEKLTTRVQQLEASEKELREESAKLSVSNETLTLSYSAKSAELESQISAVVKLKSEVELLKKDDTLAVTQQELENTSNLLKARDVEIAELRDAATNLENQLFDGESELRGKLDSLLLENNKLEEAKATLESDMQVAARDAKIKAERLQQSITDMEAAMVAATEKRTEQEGRVEILEGKLQLQIKSSQDHLESELEKLTKQYEEKLSNSSSSLSTELATVKASHETALADQAKQHDLALQSLQTATDTKLHETQELLNEANTKIKQLEDTHAMTTQTMEESKVELEVELHTLINESKGKQQKLEKQIHAKDNEVVTLTQKLAELEEESLLTKSEIERLRSELETQEGEVAEMRAVRQECDAQMTTLMTKLERQEASHSIAIEEWDNKVQELQGRLLTEEAIRRADAEADAYNESQSCIDDEEEPPPEGISKKDWVSSKGVKTCKQCMNKFSLRNRKHHCRRCGGVFCGKCCPSSPLTDNVRVCVSCNSQK